MASSKSSPSIRVLVADDHRLFRQGLSQICQMKGGFVVVAEAANGQEAVDLSCRLRPEVILMDIRMPVLDGVQATRLITSANPELRVIVLTMHREDRFVFNAIKAGASGYLLKDVDAEDLLHAIRAVHRGEAMIDPLIAARLLQEFRRGDARSAAIQENLEELTKGEMAVLRCVAEGMDNHDIASELGLAESTVANRLGTVYQKLHVNNRTQAALYALRHGWASLDSK